MFYLFCHFNEDFTMHFSYLCLILKNPWCFAEKVLILAEMCISSLPPQTIVLNLQLDNVEGDNKNRFVFGF